MNENFAAFLSQKQFDCLAFWDPRSLDKDQRNAVASCMNEALQCLLTSIEYRHESWPGRDQLLRYDLKIWMDEKLAHSSKFSAKFLEIVLHNSAFVPECMYPNASHSARLQFDVWQQNAPRSEISALFADSIRGWNDHFGAQDPRMGSLSGTGWANFMEECALEHVFDTEQAPHLFYRSGNLKSHGCCPQGFASYFRQQSGFPLPMAIAAFKPSRKEEVALEYLLPSMDQLVIFINAGNDLFSWPKEMLDGEVSSYMALQTLSKRQGNFQTNFTPLGCDDELWTFRDAICETMTLLFDSTRALNKAFVDFASVCEEPHASKWKVALASRLWQAGSIAFHINYERYRLGKLQEI